MAGLTGSSISSTYERLLILPSGGGSTTALKTLQDGDGVTTFALQLASDKVNFTGNIGIGETSPDELIHIKKSSNYKIKFEYTGEETYELVHGVSGLYVDKAGTTLVGFTQDHDLTVYNSSGNSYVNFDGSTTKVKFTGAIEVGVDGTGHDVKFFSDTPSNHMLWSQALDQLQLQGTSSMMHISTTAGAQRDTAQLIISGNTGGGAPGLATAIQLESDTDNRGKGVLYTNDDNTEIWFHGVPYQSSDPDSFMIGYHTNPTAGDGSDLPYYIAQAKLMIKSDGKVGVGETAPDTTLHVKGAAATSLEVLKLEQLDDNEPFIRFQGTTASDQTKSLSTDTSVGSHEGHIRVSINGTDKWIPYYATN